MDWGENIIFFIFVLFRFAREIEEKIQQLGDDVLKTNEVKILAMAQKSVRENVHISNVVNL